LIGQAGIDGDEHVNRATRKLQQGAIPSTGPAPLLLNRLNSGNVLDELFQALAKCQLLEKYPSRHTGPRNTGAPASTSPAHSISAREPGTSSDLPRVGSAALWAAGEPRSSAEDFVDVELNVWQRDRDKLLAAAAGARDRVAVGGGRLVDEHHVTLQVHQPYLGHAGDAVAGDFDRPVIGERCVGHLDQQQHVGWAGPRRRIVVITTPQDGNIRLELVSLAKHHGVLHPDQGTAAETGSEQVGQAPDARGMTRPRSGSS
jgi:hypothetical protein